MVFVCFGGGSKAEYCQANGARGLIDRPHDGWTVATGMKQKMYAGQPKSATDGAAATGGEPGCDRKSGGSHGARGCLQREARKVVRRSPRK